MDIFNQMRAKRSKDTEMKFYKVMAVIVVTHGSEVWTVTRKTGSRNRNCRNEIV
jgi:hypothetical protein